MMPNIPIQPINGMTKHYDNDHRSFTRPYSAKNIVFYADGDEYFTGIRLPVTKARYRTMDSLMDDLTGKMPLTYGVRRVFTPVGGTEVTDFNQLKHEGKYVCGSTKWARKLNLSAVERLHRMRKEAEEKNLRNHRRARSHNDTLFASSVAALKQKERFKTLNTTHTPPIPQKPKQILFVRNGSQNHVYRTLIRVQRPPLFDELLTEVSQGLQVPIYKLYTQEGKKIISVEDILNGPMRLLACQRHERPQTDDNSHQKFPPITRTNRFVNQSNREILLSKENGTSKRQNSSSKESSVASLPPLPPNAKQRRVTKTGGHTTTGGQNKKEIIQSNQRRQSPAKRSRVATYTEAAPEINRDQSEAVTKIQAGVRGYIARKQLSDEQRAATKIQAGARGYLTRKRTANGLYGATADDFEKQEQAAVMIQAAFRGHAVRESLKNPEEQVPETKVEKKKKRKKVDSTVTGKVTYAVSVFTGNRWGADFDGDLYIEIFGDKGDSDKVWLKQDPIDQKFMQNQVDTFDVEIPYLGTLQKISVGHELQGYGAGTFLERVIITDTIVDMKQFVFICSKWMDSGQVDRKLIRSMEHAGVYNLTSIPDALADLQELGEANALSKGRWSVKVQNGSKPHSGTTSNISIIGFGSFGRSEIIQLDNPSLKLPGAESTFQVNFGSIGDLYKMRFLTEEQGEDPSWLLDNVGLKDLDTGEELTLYSGKWLGSNPNSKLKGAGQLFRELPVVRVGIEPLPVVQYSVKVVTADLTGIDQTSPVSIHLMGEYGDSGTICFNIPPSNGNGKTEVHEMDFKLEAVSIGRLWSVNVEFKLDTNGETFSEAFIALQDIYEKQNMSLSSGSEWGIEKVLVRESLHAPYQFVFGDSRIMSSETPGTVKKQILLTEMEGLSTKAKTKNASPKSKGIWSLWVTTGDHSESAAVGVPLITVYGDKGMTDPIPLQRENTTLLAGKTVEFQIDVGDIGSILKIRMIIAPEQKGSDNASWYLKNLKMKDMVTGDELRFPVEMWLDAETVIEIPAIWPDIPPLPLLLYQVTVITSAESSNDNDFMAYINILGEKGDTGNRILRNPVGTQSGSCFKPGNADTFEVEGVTVKKIKEIQVGMEHSDKTKSWHLEGLRIHDPESNKLYTFHCQSWLNSESGQAESFTPVTVENSEGIPDM